MDFKAFQQRIARAQCPKWSPRQKRLEALSRALHGKLYDDLPAAFSQERETAGFGSGDRVLLSDRRAAVEDRLPAELVRDLVGMVFGESHRPVIVAKGDDATSDWIQAFVKDSGLWLALMKTLWNGSIGSACIVLRVLGENEVDAAGGFVPKGKGTYHFELWPTFECRPVFRRSAPSELESVERTWFIAEDNLRANGYDVDALLKFWTDKKISRNIRSPRRGSAAVMFRNAESDWTMRVRLDQNAETWYTPVPRWMYERPDWLETDWIVDDARSTKHDLGETPARWMLPLPFDDSLSPDGVSLFEPVINFQFRIDRTLSQTGRAFDYAGDPQMARILDKTATGAGTFGEFDDDLAIGGTASDMVEQIGGDVKFVEARGDALKVAIEVYVKVLRDAAREAGSMSRITPDGNARTELSAVAMKMLNYSQTVVADILRVTLGERGLVPILRLAMRLWDRCEVALPSYVDEDGQPLEKGPNAAVPIDCNWPEYYELHGQDKLFEVQAISAAQESQLIGHETAVGNAAGMFDVQDAAEEIQSIDSDQDAGDARDLMLADQTAAIAAKHSPKTAGSGNGGSGA